MNPAYNAKLERAVDLHRRSVRLLSGLHQLPRKALSRRDRHFAGYYNNLRRDVREFVDDPEVRRLVPGSVWCLEIRHLLVGLLAVLVVILVTSIAGMLDWIRISDLAFLLYLAMGIVILIVFGTVAAGIQNPDHFWWWRASTVARVIENARRLEGFLFNYLPERYPELTATEKDTIGAATSRGSGSQLTAHLKQELSELQASYSMLSRRINEIDTDIGLTTESYRRGVLKEQRELLANERDDVAQEISPIESELEGLNRSR